MGERATGKWRESGKQERGKEGKGEGKQEKEHGERRE